MAHLQRPVWIPAHDLADSTEAALLPIEYFGGGRCLPALVPAGCIDMGLLASLKQLMGDYGETVAVQRMRYDRAYAFACIAAAHSASDRVLRRLAVILFEIYTSGIEDPF